MGGKKLPYNAVDMGLPSGTLWASSNIDVTQPNGFAASPFQYECSFFSWGNVDGHNPISTSAFDYDFGAENAAAPWYEGQPYGETQGCTLQTTIPVGDTYDAARVNCGSIWRMPTLQEVRELLNNIIYINADGTEVDTSRANKLVTVNGIVGAYMESKINGNRLFFANTGRAKNSSYLFQETESKYWCTLYQNERDAWYWGFDIVSVSSGGWSTRSRGFAIRPVI